MKVDSMEGQPKISTEFKVPPMDPPGWSSMPPMITATDSSWAPAMDARAKMSKYLMIMTMTRVSFSGRGEEGTIILYPFLR